MSGLAGADRRARRACSRCRVGIGALNRAGRLDGEGLADGSRHGLGMRAVVCASELGRRSARAVVCPCDSTGLEAVAQSGDGLGVGSAAALAGAVVGIAFASEGLHAGLRAGGGLGHDHRVLVHMAGLGDGIGAVDVLRAVAACQVGIGRLLAKSAASQKGAVAVIACKVCQLAVKGTTRHLQGVARASRSNALRCADHRVTARGLKSAATDAEVKTRVAIRDADSSGSGIGRLEGCGLEVDRARRLQADDAVCVSLCRSRGRSVASRVDAAVNRDVVGRRCVIGTYGRPGTGDRRPVAVCGAQGHIAAAVLRIDAIAIGRGKGALLKVELGRGADSVDRACKR